MEFDNGFARNVIIFVADKANNENVNFPSQFSLGSTSTKCMCSVDAEGISLKKNVYDFSVDYDAIDKSDILNILKSLMVKNNKIMFRFMK